MEKGAGISGTHCKRVGLASWMSWRRDEPSLVWISCSNSNSQQHPHLGDPPGHEGRRCALTAVLKTWAPWQGQDFTTPRKLQAFNHRKILNS